MFIIIYDYANLGDSKAEDFYKNNYVIKVNQKKYKIYMVAK